MSDPDLELGPPPPVHLSDSAPRRVVRDFQWIVTGWDYLIRLVMKRQQRQAQNSIIRRLQRLRLHFLAFGNFLTTNFNSLREWFVAGP